MSISSICGALYGEKVRDSSPSLDLTRGSNHEVNLASLEIPIMDILELSKFHSSKSDKPIFLSEYLERIKKNQSEIFYISSDNIGRAKTSPHLEGLDSKGLEVLFFVDPIDTFWLQMVQEYEGNSFTSITKGSIDLSKFDEENKSEDKKKKRPKGKKSKLDFA